MDESAGFGISDGTAVSGMVACDHRCALLRLVEETKLTCIAGDSIAKYWRTLVALWLLGVLVILVMSCILRVFGFGPRGPVKGELLR